MLSVNRDALQLYVTKGQHEAWQHELAQLRLNYSEIATLDHSFVASLENKARIYPTILPTQASGRWSYLNPPLSGFPKKCINPACPVGHHSRTKDCWDMRDCFLPDDGTFWIEFDLDAIEHKIYCLILDWKERLSDMATGIDIHTPVTCQLFQLPLPSNLQDPHTAPEDATWRETVHWQGKDDPRRTMSKNFTYGAQYFYVQLARGSTKPRLPRRQYRGLLYNPEFVYSIPHIQSYRIPNSVGELVVPDYLQLAIRFVESNSEIQRRKALWMEKICREKVVRTLYGGRRLFWLANEDTAKVGFNHIMQGTVASYINETAILLQKAFPESYLVHNKHDSLKWAFPYLSCSTIEQERQRATTLGLVKKHVERSLSYQDRSIKVTATFKII